MASNAQKTPIAASLNQWQEDRQRSFNQQLGRSVPASIVEIDETGTIVTVQFEIESDLFTLPNVQCALATDEFTRPPLKKGSKGYVVPADYYMGGVTGLGGGVATFDRQPNLSALVFHPCGNKEYSKLYDKDRYVIFGPKGVVIRDTDGTVIVTIGAVDNGAKNVIQAKLVAASDDADAAGKGIPINGFYQTSGAVKVRLT